MLLSCSSGALARGSVRGPARAPQRPGRRASTVPHACNDAREIVLPHGVWLLSEGEPDVPVFGPGEHGFVMRALTADWGLGGGADAAAPSSRRWGGIVGVLPPGLEPLAALPASTCTGLVPFGGGRSEETGMVPFEGGWLSEEGPVPDVSLASSGQMMGVVLGAGLTRCQESPLPAAPGSDNVYEVPHSSSPRRTQKIRFTCGRCGATNIKPINPHAWTSGSVFAKCAKCNITHKLIDNLKLFHELTGPVFPAAAPSGAAADALDLPESMRLRLHPELGPGFTAGTGGDRDA